jgi:hypothetical protein
MAKVSAKKQVNIQQRITVYFGYGLFFITVVGVVLSLVPWGSMFSVPGVLYWNVLSTIIAFALATLLPLIAGYIVGDKATRNTSKLAHHYNGILFGVLGFWLASVLSSSGALANSLGYSDTYWLYLLGSVAPAIVAAVAVTVIGVFYARTAKHQSSLLNYKPYQAVFLVSIIGMLSIMGVSAASGVYFGANLGSSIAVLLLPVLMIVLVVIFGAVVIGVKNGTFLQRVMKSLVALGFATVGAASSSVLLAYSGVTSIIGQWSFIVGVVVWLAYTIALRRTASAQK